MSRYIDADKLREDFIRWFDTFDWEDGETEKHTIATVIRTIDAMPTANVVEVKHGEWIKFDEGDCYCSNCGFALEDWVQGIFYKFCPNCGADMRGVE